MATYAAMVDHVDRGVGRVLQTLDDLKIRDNTRVIFMNDNGASPNDRVRKGQFGTPGTTWNVGVAWANVSNTPFKYYKRTQHSGGVTTPFIAQWPAAITPSATFIDQPCHITDILPTFIDVSGGSYPADFGSKQHPPLPGRSFAPILKSNETLPERTLHFALFNNMALIDHGWKIATAYGEPWQLYDINNDRTETHNLAESNPDKLMCCSPFKRPSTKVTPSACALPGASACRIMRQFIAQTAISAPVSTRTWKTKLSLSHSPKPNPKVTSSTLRNSNSSSNKQPPSPRRRKARSAKRNKTHEDLSRSHSAPFIILHSAFDIRGGAASQHHPHLQRRPRLRRSWHP